MDIEALIQAAWDIDRLAESNEARSKAWRELAAYARKPGADRQDIERRRCALDASVVVDFSTAIARLRHALRAR